MSSKPAKRIQIRPEVFEEMLAERGLSIGAFQQESGLARSTVERARRGEPLTMSTLLRIADTLDQIPERPTISRLIGAASHRPHGCSCEGDRGDVASSRTL